MVNAVVRSKADARTRPKRFEATGISYRISGCL